MIHDRKKRYQSLCKEVANYTFSAADDESLKSVFEPCPACKEINLWTYWHGWESLNEQDDSVHPKILLVGQDWGSYYLEGDETAEKRLEMLGSDPAKYTQIFSSLNNGPVTDKNLKDLFVDPEGFSCDLDKKQPDLFFTNLIPWYRKKEENISGFRRAWLTGFVKKYFRDLVRILEPEVVMCLGKNTYLGVLDSLGLRKENPIRQRSYTEFLDSKRNYVDYLIEEEIHCTVWALKHCGGQGSAGRCIAIQREDWKEVLKKCTWNV